MRLNQREPECPSSRHKNMTDKTPRISLLSATYFAGRARQYEEKAKAFPEGSSEREDAFLIAWYMQRKAERCLLRKGALAESSVRGGSEA
jgi:hypothetical protein